jgi:hypothetical protein
VPEQGWIRWIDTPADGHKPEEILAKLRQVDVLASQGQSMAEAVRSIGVTQFTDYRWRKERAGVRHWSKTLASGDGRG